jgi:hypothetical protein
VGEKQFQYPKECRELFPLFALFSHLQVKFKKRRMIKFFDETEILTPIEKLL